MLVDILPRSVATESMQALILSGEEGAWIGNAVEKRRWYFHGGRNAAKAALRQFGFCTAALADQSAAS